MHRSLREGTPAYCDCTECQGRCDNAVIKQSQERNCKNKQTNKQKKGSLANKRHLKCRILRLDNAESPLGTSEMALWLKSSNVRAWSANTWFAVHTQIWVHKENRSTYLLWERREAILGQRQVGQRCHRRQVAGDVIDVVEREVKVRDRVDLYDLCRKIAEFVGG